MAKKWEYKVISESLDTHDQDVQLNREGEDGWELVTVVRVGDDVWLYLKR